MILFVNGNKGILFIREELIGDIAPEIARFIGTNKTFFENFASNANYYFEHSRDDFSNLFDADSEGDDKIKMFHYTTIVEVIENEHNYVEGIKYSGSILMLLNSDIDESIDHQYDGKYEKYIKSMVENGGVIKDMIDYNSINDNHNIKFSEIKEVYNMFDFNADGIYFKYEMEILV